MKYIKLYEDFDNILVDKLRKLRKYVQVLKKEKEDKDAVNLAEKFFIILHNYLILECGFSKELKIVGWKEINNCLNLDNSADIYEKFLKLYDPNSLVRYNIEKFTENDIIKNYIENKPYIFERLLDMNETLKDIDLFIIRNKYNI